MIPIGTGILQVVVQAGRLASKTQPIAMKIFLSWSGDRSRNIAEALNRWLPDVFPEAEPWISTRDITAGTRWLVELNSRLEAADFGILCLTPENLRSSWLMYEAGSLGKSVGGGRVIPYLTDLESHQIPSPLQQFQGVKADREGTLKLLTGINKYCNTPFQEEKLIRHFSVWWPNLQSELNAIPLLEGAALDWPLVSRKPPAKELDGVWVATFSVKRSGRIQKYTEIVELATYPNGITGHVLPDSRSYESNTGQIAKKALRLHGKAEESSYFTGFWVHPVEKARYHGTFQLLINPNGDKMSGRWIGFSESLKTIDGGAWDWERDTQSK